MDRLNIVLDAIVHADGDIASVVLAHDALNVSGVDARGFCDLDECHGTHHFLPFAASLASFL